MRHSVLTLSALFVLACAASQPETRGAGAPQLAPSPTVAPSERTDGNVKAALGTPDGTSFEHAVIIDAPNEQDGIAKEYRWVAEHFPGYRMQKQSLNKHQGRSYDILHITDASGAEHMVYFDIESFFGKM